MALSSEAELIAGRFLSARREGRGLDEFPGRLPETLEKAYAIQDEAIAAWGAPVIGWKVGRILPPLSDQLGSDRLAGPIFSAVQAQSGEAPEMPIFADGFAAGEAEFVLRIGSDLDPHKRAYSLEEAADLIEAVHVGVEIASSPLKDINGFGPTAVVSDFGNNSGLVVGAEVRDWRSSGFESWDVVTTIDGAKAGEGRASSFPDGAIGAARFLFELSARRGVRLRKGQWISSGAVTGVHEARPGQSVEARFGPHHRLRCTLV